MHKVVVKAGTLSAARTLHAKRRRANDNAIDVPAAGAEVRGALTSVVRASPRTCSPAVARAAHDDGLAVIGLRYLARLWAAFARERAIARAASSLAGMSDRQLHDIGIERSEIDLAVRVGRPNRGAGMPAGAAMEAER